MYFCIASLAFDCAQSLYLSFGAWPEIAKYIKTKLFDCERLARGYNNVGNSTKLDLVWLKNMLRTFFYLFVAMLGRVQLVE